MKYYSAIYKIIDIFYWDLKKKWFFLNDVESEVFIVNKINNFIKIGLLKKNVKSIVKANNIGKWISVKLINNCKYCFLYFSL